MHQALYRKYRPKTFDDVCGQEHVTDVLKYQVKTGTVSHAYLFCGSRGTGKTTCAKILAKAVNCPDMREGNPCCECETCRNIDAGLSVDVLEMDAASNTGVDYIRDIKENVAYSASEVKNKVFIIDEVHMLSTSAFNALLKTLEEPPENVIFVLATTEMHKIPATVLSRCQRFEFRRIPDEIIVNRLSYIAEKEGFEIDSDAARLIALLSRGGMRDAVSMLELCSASGKRITLSAVREASGVAGREDVIDIYRALVNKDFPTVFAIINRLRGASKDFAAFVCELLSFYRDMILIRACGKKIDKNLFELTDGEFEATAECSEMMKTETMLYQAEVLEDTLSAISKNTADAAMLTELCFVQMATPSLNTTPKALLARISALESGVSVHQPTQAAVSAPRPVKQESAPSENKQGEFSEKPVTFWSDVVQKISVTDVSTGAFLQKTKACLGSDGKLRVYSPDSFTASMIKRGDLPERILGAASDFDGRITDIEITVKADTSKQDDDVSELDEFIRNSEEE